MSTIFNFFRKTEFNQPTLEQLWLSIINDTHDSICNCTRPFIHLLALLFTEEHKDRHLTIHNIITREFKEHQCLFGGDADKNIGMALAATQQEEGEKPTEEREDLTEEDIELLIAATDAAEEEEPR